MISELHGKFLILSTAILCRLDLFIGERIAINAQKVLVSWFSGRYRVVALWDALCLKEIKAPKS